MGELDTHRPLIESALALAGGTHSFADIEQGVRESRYQFWPGVKSVIVTEVVQFPQKKVIHCFLAAGEMEEINNMRTWLENWARMIGVSRVTICGRKGWERVLAGAGYEPTAVWLEKDLEV